MDPIIREKLLYRRQYLYGPSVKEFPGWTNLKTPTGYSLAVHLDLDVTEIHENGLSLILLGYMLDPKNPGFDNRKVLSDLCSKSNTSQDIITGLDEMGGRYVLFIYAPDAQLVLNDAAGMRQVFFHIAKNGDFWIAAQPGLLSDRFNFEYTTEAREFLQSETILKYREPWWPGNSTPFEEVKHLLPNHHLNLISGQVTRYWPRQPIKKFTFEEGAKKASAILRNLMKAAHNRFEMAIGLTGGFDSRIVFAACKDFVKDLHVYSMMYHRLRPTSPDITISGELADFAGVPHQVFDCHQPMDEDFTYLYTHNLEESCQSYGNIVYGRFMNLDQSKVVIKSVVNEICRCFYYRTGVYPYKVTPDFLCRVSKLGEHPFVRRKFAEWMEDAQPVVDFGYKLLDFFYWENRNANWQAMSQLEFDLAHEEFTPFDHRTLLATMLGVDHKFRCMPKNTFQRELVRQSWPELDQFPYNPRRKVIKKPFYEGPWMTLGRWVKYNILRKK